MIKFYKIDSGIINFCTSNNIKSNNLNDVAFQRFNNLSNSAINNNNSNYQELTSTKTNNSLSNSMNNIKELQTPLIIKRRLKLIKKF